MFGLKRITIAQHERGLQFRNRRSLRVNLTALWQVQDAVKARGMLTNFVEFTYKELPARRAGARRAL